MLFPAGVQIGVEKPPVMVEFNKMSNQNYGHMEKLAAMAAIRQFGGQALGGGLNLGAKALQGGGRALAAGGRAARAAGSAAAQLPGKGLHALHRADHAVSKGLRFDRALKTTAGGWGDVLSMGALSHPVQWAGLASAFPLVTGTSIPDMKGYVKAKSKQLNHWWHGGEEPQQQGPLPPMRMEQPSLGPVGQPAPVAPAGQPAWTSPARASEPPPRPHPWQAPTVRLPAGVSYPGLRG